MPRKRRTKIPPHKAYQSRILRRPSRKLNYLIGLLSLVVLVFASSTVLKIMSGETTSLPEETSYQRVQVLNGCGINKAASTIGGIVRNMDVPTVDFDVIDEDDFESYDVLETIIIARDERSVEFANMLADGFGINRDNVVAQYLEDNYLSLDLTVIVGKDFESIVGRFDSRDGH